MKVRHSCIHKEFQAGDLWTGTTNFQVVKRDLRHIGIVGMLLWSLLHAWFGHDLVHGHHHKNLGEATYSTAPSRSVGADQVLSLATVALLTTFCDLLVYSPTVVLELRDFEYDIYRDPQFLEKVHSPRAPPASPLAV